MGLKHAVVKFTSEETSNLFQTGPEAPVSPMNSREYMDRF